MLALTAHITGIEKEKAMLSYQAAGNPTYRNTAGANIKAGQAVELVAGSPAGFQDSLRFQPISGASKIVVSDLSVRCWVLRAAS